MRSLGYLNENRRSLAGSFERISTGHRIAKAADDAAGLAVAENLDMAEISLRQAGRNAADGVSVIQTAEGASDTVADLLMRQRELAVQSASETLHSDERAYVASEFDELSGEIDRVAATTKFGAIGLTDGSMGTMNVQVGKEGTAADRITINLGDLNRSTMKTSAGYGASPSAQVDTVTNAKSALGQIDGMLDVVNGYRSSYGAVQNRLESSIRNTEVYAENLAGAQSTIRDADFAFETAQMSKHQVMEQVGLAVLGQANGISQGALRLL